MFKSEKKNQKILEQYKEVKTSNFDFDRISLFHTHTDKTDAGQIISDATCRDLDFEELFMYVDRTSSRIGQQYLYATLRTIPENNAPRFEKIINYLNENPQVKESTVLELHKLNSPGAYFIQRLMYAENITKPKWFWVLPVLSSLSVITLIWAFFYPMLMFAFLAIVVANNIIHFWNKNNILGYSNTIPQLLILHQITSKLLSIHAFVEGRDKVQKSYRSLKKMAGAAVFFKWEAKLTDEIGQTVEFILDLLKGAFLFEPLLFFRLLKQVDSKREEIENLYQAVSKLDVALSVSSLRESLPYYCFPTFIAFEKSLQSKEIYHPLTVNPIANSIDTSDGRSMLISGSNMSGKTTFIRTIGINTILAQTINTACAKEFIVPRLKIHTSIRISDDLMDDTSYYYAEVKRIKALLLESVSDDQNLFLLDELFKGTNTVERVALGKAILSYLNQKNNLVFASTHDLELTEFLNEGYNYFHFSEIIENNQLKFDYKLKKGKLTDTNAIRILEINDFPKEVTEEARSMAGQLDEAKKMRTN